MKHVVITGAADGIGKALAYRFVQAGYDVTGVDVDAERAAEVESDLGVRFVIGDLSLGAGVTQVLDGLRKGKKIDVMIHNAGINAVGRFLDVSLKSQERVIEVNLSAPMVLTAGLLEAEQIQSGGSLVFMSSLSHYVSYPGAAVYAASKSGLASYARSLSVALVPRDIHVMTVFPGPTRTAHARRYSPDNAREGSRMAPEELAKRIFAAVQKKKRHLVPGFGKRVFAFLGKWYPRMMEDIMRRIILEKL